MLLNRLLRRNDKKIYKEICVDKGKTLRVTGKVSFGSEPYLIRIGRNVTLTDGVKFLTHDGACDVVRRKTGNFKLDLIKPIVVGDNVFIGNDTIILYGVTIGNDVIIGCNSVVTKDIPSNSVCAGCPAKRICSVDEFYSKHQEEFIETKQMSKEQKESYLKEKYKI